MSNNNSNSLRPQLPWNNAQELALLKAIDHKQAHLSGSTKVWLDVQAIIRDQDCFEAYKEEHFSSNAPESVRKLKNKLTKIYDAYQKVNGWGDFYGGTSQNLSKFDGDLASAAKIVRKLLEESEKQKVEKEMNLARKKEEEAAKGIMVWRDLG